MELIHIILQWYNDIQRNRQRRKNANRSRGVSAHSFVDGARQRVGGVNVKWKIAWALNAHRRKHRTVVIVVRPMMQLIYERFHTFVDVKTEINWRIEQHVSAFFLNDAARNAIREFRLFGSVSMCFIVALHLEHNGSTASLDTLKVWIAFDVENRNANQICSPGHRSCGIWIWWEALIFLDACGHLKGISTASLSPSSATRSLWPIVRIWVAGLRGHKDFSSNLFYLGNLLCIICAHKCSVTEH